MVRSDNVGPEYQERFGYLPLTREAKRKILGHNAARAYGIDVEEIR